MRSSNLAAGRNDFRAASFVEFPVIYLAAIRRLLSPRITQTCSQKIRKNAISDTRSYNLRTKTATNCGFRHLRANILSVILKP
jgi:hypothetical protein